MKTKLFALGYLLLAIGFQTNAQMQQSWVAKYNNSLTNGTNQTVAMALDNSGNIYVTGFSLNIASNLDYVTIKYAPNGNQVWATRLDSTNHLDDKPVGLALDKDNNVIVMGTAGTVKYDTNGIQQWTAPYAGRALAVDTNGSVLVTGFLTNDFSTVKLAPSGTNLWLRTYDAIGHTDISQVIAVDDAGNAYVAGMETYFYQNMFANAARMAVIKYDPNGTQLWKTNNSGGGGFLQVEGITMVGSSNIYIVADFFSGGNGEYTTFKFTSNGTSIWTSYDAYFGSQQACGFRIDSQTNIIISGHRLYSYCTAKLNSNGNLVWTNFYPNTPTVPNTAMGITLDSAGNSYVTGYAESTNSGYDIATLKYDPSGNQCWLQRYNGTANGDDAGNVIAVDAKGNVYVAGYETVAGGGTQMILIKYSVKTIDHHADGTFHFQYPGIPGQSYIFQMATNLQTWTNIATNIADTNNIVQFYDTNVLTNPARFFRTLGP